MIPLKYNVRNMRVRWVNTLMTVLGTALVVWSSCILFGLVDGLQHSLKVSGDPLDLIVLRKGATNETSSGFDKAKADDLATLGGIARDESGQAAGRLGAAQHPDRRAARRQPDEHHRPGGLRRLAQAPARLHDPAGGARLPARQGRMHRQPQPVEALQGGRGRRDAPARRGEERLLPRRRPVHRRRQRRRERGLGRHPGPRTHRRPRRERLDASSSARRRPTTSRR